MSKRDMHLLYEYNRGCNARILGAASTLTAQKFRAPGLFPHGGLRHARPRPVRRTGVRMRWQGTAPEFHSRLKPEEFPTVAALHARWMEEDALLMAFVARLTDESLNTDLEYTSTEGGRHKRVVWETMAHLVNHGTQHRTEAAAMLTAFGHSPGDIDLAVFLNEHRR